MTTQREVEPVRMGVIGVGAISGAYLGMAKNFPIVEVAACADLDMDRARAAAAQHGVPKALSVDELLRDDSIELVLNLTIPKAHADVALRAIEAGKHTYAEKPFGVNRAEGLKKPEPAIFRLALSRAGCRPDQALMVGDRVDNDIRPARQIGMATARVRQGLAAIQEPADESQQPDVTVPATTGLPAVLAE